MTHRRILAALLTATLACAAACATTSTADPAPDGPLDPEDPTSDDPQDDPKTGGANPNPRTDKPPAGSLVAVAEDDMEEGESVDDMANEYTAAVEKLFNARHNEVNTCYLRELKKDPSLKGSLTVEFTVVPGGKISEGPNIRNDSIQNAKVADCILAIVKSLKYPEPYNDEYATVKRRFTFGAF